VKVITVVGARPQFIKASTISRVIRSRHEIQEVLIHTGQHFDKEMSDIFFSDLEIPKPDYHLGIQASTHSSQTGRMLESIEKVLLDEKPDCLLVYGDTNSTLAGALAAVKLHIPVIHIEAGLRSFNRKMPEEINRILTDHCSELLFAPTETAVANLRGEGVAESSIFNMGDVMFDAALFYEKKAETLSDILSEIGVNRKGYILATVHRAENTDHPSKLQAIFEALNELAGEIPVVLPLHPRTRQSLKNVKMLPKFKESLHLIKPVGYLDMVKLISNSSLVVTDSGGLQKEAFFFQIPCVTLRSETEWVELVELKWNVLIDPVDAKKIYQGILKSIGGSGKQSQPYGNGRAAEKIVNKMLETYK
jgi:UDP-GlcNAc3NAcA epimerase